MSNQLVLPIVMSAKSADASDELREAFATAEPAEKAKIADWAWRFGFETTNPFMVDLGVSESNAESVASEILQEVEKAHAVGVVVAGIDYLRRAQILDSLFSKLSTSHLELWSANLGSEPVSDLLEV